MGVHLNYPITAQRGTHNSRPARGSCGCLTPLSHRGTAKGCVNKTESTPRSPRLGPGSGDRRAATPRGYAPNADVCQYVRMALPRPAETLPMPVETNTSHTDKLYEKTLQEHSRSCKASGAPPAGALARPHGTAQQPGGKNVPSASISLCGSLMDTTTEPWGLLSGQP
jgi:hypothetical protein